jgi:diguanylate cyclase (GGDEF)-like protein
LGPAVIGWMVAVEATAAVWAAVASQAEGWPTAGAWQRWVVLVAAASLYSMATRIAEERRRATDLAEAQTEHVDHTSVFLATGALVLPASLMTALLLVVRAQRYPIARTPLARFVFSTAAIAVSQAGVHTVAMVTPLRDWTLAEHPAAPQGMTEVAVVAAVGLALGAYFAAQAIGIGTARALRMGRLRWSVLGTLEDNWDILTTLFLAVYATLVMLVGHGGLIIFVLPLVIDRTNRAQLIQRLRDALVRVRGVALTDHMTGLNNRRGFALEAEAALAVDRQYQQSTVVGIIDADWFKKINDTYGHPAGDEVLRRLAGVLRPSRPDDINPGSVIRAGDISGRLGGEEFGLLLPNTDLDAAVGIAERIREGVEQLAIKVTRRRGGATQTIGVTVSIGLALVVEGQTLEQALAEADVAVYESKERGRNRISVADSPVATGAELPPAVSLR